MVAFELYSKNKTELIYWHYPEGNKENKHGVIVVTIAYRTGVFGYFADKELAAESEHGTTGNYGLLDQIKALEWVHNNISAFGGNAANVTIAGESAGSSSVNALCATPLTKGFFRRAIGESSSVIQETPPHTFRTMEAALKMGDDIKAEFKCQNIKLLRILSELWKMPLKWEMILKLNSNVRMFQSFALFLLIN